MIFTTSFNCKICNRTVVLENGRGQCKGCRTKYTFSCELKEEDLTITQPMEDDDVNGQTN